MKINVYILMETLEKKNKIVKQKYIFFKITKIIYNSYMQTKSKVYLQKKKLFTKIFIQQVFNLFHN